MMSCACGLPFVPEYDYYVAHVQTPEHQLWRWEVIDAGRPISQHEALRELFGLIVPRGGAE